MGVTVVTVLAVSLIRPEVCMRGRYRNASLFFHFLRSLLFPSSLLFFLLSSAFLFLLLTLSLSSHFLLKNIMLASSYVL